MQSLLITAAQFRAARALLNWSRQDLVDKSGISIFTIKKVERSDEDLKSVKDKTLQSILDIYSLHGIEFIQESSSKVGILLKI